MTTGEEFWEIRSHQVYTFGRSGYNTEGCPLGSERHLYYPVSFTLLLYFIVFSSFSCTIFDDERFTQKLGGLHGGFERPALKKRKMD